MKITIVSAFHITRKPEYNSVEKPELEGKTATSFRGIAKFLTEGDSVTVQVGDRGYKNVSIEDGLLYVQRIYAFEY